MIIVGEVAWLSQSGLLVRRIVPVLYGSVAGLVAGRGALVYRLSDIREAGKAGCIGIRC